MNAYELADIVDRWAYKESAEYLTDAANMLRQQADRISELEDRLSMYEIKDLDRGIIGRTKDYAIHDLVYRTTPQIKELSDEEIRTIQDMCHLKNVGYNTFIMRFARAILKKASEK